MSIEITLLISVLSFSFAIYQGTKNMKRTDTKDIEERVKENTQINMKLDEALMLMKETRNEVANMRDEIKSHDGRIIKVEESAKQAHHRLDALENRLDK